MSITLLIVLFTVLVSYQAFSDPVLFNKLTHMPWAEVHRKEYYRLLTAGFVHGSWMHLLINMYVFYEFGQYVERQFLLMFGPTMGRIWFLVLYLLTIVMANLGTMYKHRHNPTFRSVGASGAVSGVLFAFVLFQPWATLLLFFIIPVPAVLAAVLYLIYSSWASKHSSDHIDHDAHFYGAVFGMLFTLVLQPALFPYFVEALLRGMPF